jgi:putative holliday junction resolvase
MAQAIDSQKVLSIMKRWLALDLGTVRIGVALSDPLGLTAQPLTVLKASGSKDDIVQIGKLIDEYQVERVIVGLPLNMDGTESSQSQRVREFTGKLAERLNVPVFYADERLTSRQAERAMIEGKARREKRRQKTDQVAAALLLQGALGGMPLVPVEKA